MCELAETQLGWTHLSTGELLREVQQGGGPRAAVIDECLEAGQLVPNEIVVTLLQQAMERIIRATGKTNFLLDGFPRSLNNLEAWYEIYGRDATLPKMLYLECPYEVLEQRILGRANFTGRRDDNIESIRMRFETFKAETLPTVELFRSKDLCVEIDTSQSRQAVSPSSRIAWRNSRTPPPRTSRSLRNPKCSSAYARFQRRNNEGSG